MQAQTPGGGEKEMKGRRKRGETTVGTYWAFVLALLPKGIVIPFSSYPVLKADTPQEKLLPPLAPGCVCTIRGH